MSKPTDLKPRKAEDIVNNLINEDQPERRRDFKSNRGYGEHADNSGAPEHFEQEDGPEEDKEVALGKSVLKSILTIRKLGQLTSASGVMALDKIEDAATELIRMHGASDIQTN